MGMKCSFGHTFAPIDSKLWRPNSLHHVLLGSRLVEAQLPPIREEAQLPPLHPVCAPPWAVGFLSAILQEYTGLIL